MSVMLESKEMYLETIYVLSLKMTSVRSIDVANYMNYSKPSVSRAMGLLKNDGYISVDSNGYITLSEDGKNIATKIYERHTVITDLLIGLGVDPEIAEQDACRVEHYLSDETFEAIKSHSKKYGNDK